MSWAELPGVALHADISGQGRSVVLLHELGGSLHSFDDVMVGLGDRFRVLRYDQRGAGLSEKPRTPFTVADHAADLEALLRWSGVGRPAILVGVAAACAIAAEYAVRQPANVAGLLLCGPVMAATGPQRSYLADRSERAVQQGMCAVVDPSLDRSYPPHLRGDGVVFAAYRARMLGNDPVGYAHANMALAQATTEQRLGRLRGPCDVLAGRHDLLRSTEQLRETVSGIPGATFTVVESGHLMAVQTPGLVADAIQALADRTTKESPA